MADEPLWIPSTERVTRARLTSFRRHLERRWDLALPDYSALHTFSITAPDAFWMAVWEFCGVIGDMGGRVVEGLDRMPGARFFPQARLNFAENLLRRRDERVAIVFSGEGKEPRQIRSRELAEQVEQCARALRGAGVGPGDRVAGYVANAPEAIVAALAAAAIGAVWSSCSPDFGVQGVLDRFGQIEPSILFAIDGYYYGGKTHDTLDRVAAVAQRLPTLRRTVVIPNLEHEQDERALPANMTPWRTFLESGGSGAFEYERFPFDHPLYILYSSGTTGAPKCIVHGAGGTLLQHLKEHQLQCDVQPNDRVFYFTTCGWMMWNWLVTALASDATILLYDGSPFYPDGDILFDFADRTDMTLFGTSAKFIDAVNKAGLEPRRTHRLDMLRTMTSTGSPLSPESFDFVYTKIKRDIHLASISGGTDIVSCFVGGNPIGPVWRGEIQARALGMSVEVFNERGEPIVGEKGELVCTAPFPSMPIGFWNDPGGRKYHAAYFERFPGVWCHGDFMEITGHDGAIIHGRSDAVLNPGGVRIGTAEIYRQVEQLDEVIESLVIGQQWQNDERVVLFVRLRDGVQLTPPLEDRIRRRIRENASPRHVPAKIVQVAEIPRTKSGKIVELAVRDIVHGREVRNREALANPDALEQFRNRAELGI
jgi:acetoacetyl-CoA synthetase